MKILQAPYLPPTKKPRRAKLQAPDLRAPKKNPLAFVYTLHIRKANGPTMTWNGKSFSDRPERQDNKTKYFSRKDTAARKGKELIKEFPVLKEYRMWVGADIHQIPGTSKKQRAMRGGSRSPKSNPSPRVNAELDDAAKRLEDFSGHPVAHLESAYSRSPQKTGLIIGELDLVGYRAKRDGKTERYGHHFKKNSRPLLAVTSDGKQLHIVGGQYEFTEAGIEDR
jgi:hypothetical protein